MVLYAAGFDGDKMKGDHRVFLFHNALQCDLLAEGEGEGGCCCSDLVLCLHMGHLFCIGLTDGHHPVSHPDTSLSCLPARNQLEKRRHRKLEVHEDRVFTGDDSYEDENILHITGTSRDRSAPMLTMKTHSY